MQAMRAYDGKQELTGEIRKRAELFINEFSEVTDTEKDLIVDGVDRTPAQMIAYQLGWMRLLLGWEREESEGHKVVTPHPEYRWNALGGLYQHFYDEYADCGIAELTAQFRETVDEMISMTDSYSDTELFTAGSRAWAASTPANWPVWKWIHINTVAPFTSFRTKIRKWKKLNAATPQSTEF
jgi:hypothetical protein